MFSYAHKPANEPSRSIASQVSPKARAIPAPAHPAIHSGEVAQRKLWRGAGEDEWVDDRSSTSWLIEVDDNQYRNHYTRDIYTYHGQTDQFQIGTTDRYFDPELDRVLDKVGANRYIHNSNAYSYDGRYYRRDRLYTFNVPRNEEILNNQVDLQPPVRLDLYGIDDAQVESTLSGPDGRPLKKGDRFLDRRRVEHTQEGVYTIRFEVFYAVGQSLAVNYTYRVRTPTETEAYHSEYEVPMYLGSHWTTSRFDADFSAGNLRDDINIDAQLGEGLYLTESRELGLKAGWSALMRDTRIPPPRAIVEWQVLKIPGVTLQDLPTADMPHELNWRGMPWRRDPQGGQVLRNYDTITKPKVETETKLNPRAFRKVRIRQGERLIIKDNKELFQKIQDDIGKTIKSTASKTTL